MDIDNNSLVKFIIGSHSIKYDVLNELMADIHPSDYRMGVMLVDAHSIFGKLYHDRKIAGIYEGSAPEMVRDIVVGFMNVLAHYRRYMSTRMRLDNDIYVMFNRIPPVYNRLCYDRFNEERISRYDMTDPTYGFTSKVLEVAWDFILGLSPFFEGIYCLDNSGIDDYALMSRLGLLISRLESTDDMLVMVLSTNVYGTQLIRKNWIQIHPKRDRSYLIDLEHCYSRGVLRSAKYRVSDKLTPEMLPLLWSITGCESVSVPSLGIMSTKALLQTMDQMAADGNLTRNTSIAGFLENLLPYVSSHRVELKMAKSSIEERYKALSARLSGLAITSDQLARITAQIYDVYDQNKLEQLNEILVQGRLDPEILHLEDLNLSMGMREDYDVDIWE